MLLIALLFIIGTPCYILYTAYDTYKRIQYNNKRLRTYEIIDRMRRLE